MNRWRTSRRPLIIAHRGHSFGAPEGTMAAYGLAVELGAEMIEADVGRTRDGHLVMLHDATLDRTTNGHGRVAETTYSELRELDAGSWFSAEFANEQIPSLDELFDLAARADISLCLEVKGETPDERAAIAISVAQQIASLGRLRHDVLASFDPAAMVAARRAVPSLHLAPDRLPERGPSSARSLTAQARRIGAEIIQHHHADLIPSVVDATHAAGLAIWAWPVNTTAEIERALHLGVDGLMGDDVAAITKVIQNTM